MSRSQAVQKKSASDHVSAAKRSKSGSHDRNSRRTYDRSHRYEALRARRPVPRFGVRSHRIDAFIDAFLIEREARGLSPETLRSYVADLGVFAQWLRANGHPEDPAEWDIHLLRSYVAYLQRKPSKMRVGRISAMTVRSYTSRLLAFLRWLFEEGYASTDLATKLRKPQATQRVVQSLTRSEVVLLLKAAQSDKRNGVRNLALLHLMLDSGLRASELCALRTEDVLWEQCLAKVLGKGGKERVVPFSHETAAVLRRYLLSGHRREERAFTLFQTEEGWALTPHGLERAAIGTTAAAGWRPGWSCDRRGRRHAAAGG